MKNREGALRHALGQSHSAFKSSGLSSRAADFTPAAFFIQSCASRLRKKAITIFAAVCAVMAALPSASFIVQNHRKISFIV
jgi:hypothetical protein